MKYCSTQQSTFAGKNVDNLSEILALCAAVVGRFAAGGVRHARTGQSVRRRLDDRRAPADRVPQRYRRRSAGECVANADERGILRWRVRLLLWPEEPRRAARA